LAEKAGFFLEKTMVTLLWSPDGQPEEQPRIDKGISSDSGFGGLLFSVNRR
jgi:hypothetical protein